MDIFKKMGITVGNKPLLEEYTQKSEENYNVDEYAIRRGNGSSPRDVLEQQLAKGGISFRPLTDEEMSDEDDKKKAKAVNEHLKNTHGEEFHSDNDKQAEKLQTEGGVIVHQYENEKPIKVEFKSMSVLDALSDIVKGETPVGKKISKLVGEGKPQKQAVATALNMEREGRLTSGGGYKHVKKGEEEVKMPKKEFVQEHKKLVNVLNSPSHKDDKKEAKEQKKELDAMKACKKSFAEAMTALDDIIKGAKEMPKGVSKKEFDKLSNLHENSEGVSEKKKALPVVPFLKSVGPGGMVFDFGPKTGNPLADNATQLLQENSDPVQVSNAMYNANAYSRALKDYVEKGEQAYMQVATPYGNIDKEWSKQLSTPMDTQVKEAFEKGQLVEDTSKPAVINSFNKTEMTLGGQVIKATSETDAALIEMMRGSFIEDDGTGMIADISGGSSRVAEIS